MGRTVYHRLSAVATIIAFIASLLIGGVMSAAQAASLAGTPAGVTSTMPMDCQACAPEKMASRVCAASFCTVIAVIGDVAGPFASARVAFGSRDDDMPAAWQTRPPTPPT